MAINYTQFSEGIDGIKPEERAWIESQLDADGWDPDSPPGWDAPLDDGFVGFEWEFQETSPDRRLNDDERYFWIYSEEAGYPDHVGKFVQAFLAKFRPGQCFALTFSDTCSRPRVGEFSGGGLFVTKEGYEVFDAYHWSEGRLEEFLRPAATAGSYRPVAGVQPSGSGHETRETPTKDPDSEAIDVDPHAVASRAGKLIVLGFGRPHHAGYGHPVLNLADVPDGWDPEYAALVAVWKVGGGQPDHDLSGHWPPTPEQWSTAKAEGECPIPLIDIMTGEPEDPEEPDYFVVWFEDRGGDKAPNLGFGPSVDGTLKGSDRQTNTWVSFESWTPDAGRQSELEDLGRDELVQLVLRLEAVAP